MFSSRSQAPLHRSILRTVLLYHVQTLKGFCPLSLRALHSPLSSSNLQLHSLTRASLLDILSPRIALPWTTLACHPNTPLMSHFYPSLYLPFCIYLYLSAFFLSLINANLSGFLSIRLFVFVFSLYVSIYAVIGLSFYQYACLSIHLIVCLSVYLSVNSSVLVSLIVTQAKYHIFISSSMYSSLHEIIFSRTSVFSPEHLKFRQGKHLPASASRNHGTPERSVYIITDIQLKYLSYLLTCVRDSITVSSQRFFPPRLFTKTRHKYL